MNRFQSFKNLTHLMSIMQKQVAAQVTMKMLPKRNLGRERAPLAERRGGPSWHRNLYTSSKRNTGPQI
jgi:hypothetical protein